MCSIFSCFLPTRQFFTIFDYILWIFCQREQTMNKWINVNQNVYHFYSSLLTFTKLGYINTKFTVEYNPNKTNETTMNLRLLWLLNSCPAYYVAPNTPILILLFSENAFLSLSVNPIKWMSNDSQESYILFSK